MTAATSGRSRSRAPCPPATCPTAMRAPRAGGRARCSSPPAGAATPNGTSRPGHVVWSRAYIAEGSRHVDLGRADAVERPAEEAARRKETTNPEWPVMFAVFRGVSRDQFMARHKANHVQV